MLGELEMMNNRFCRKLAKSINGYAHVWALVMSGSDLSEFHQGPKSDVRHH